MALVALLRGFNTPSLTAQGWQRLPSYFNIDRDIPGWTYGEHYWPHDGRVREWGSGVSRIEQFRERTHEYPHIIPRMDVDYGINACRHVLGICEFDEANCSEGLKALRSYRKEWDEERGVWRDKPRHEILEWANARRKKRERDGSVYLD